MVVEVPSRQGYVQVPRFPNRLPVVDALEHGEESGVLLNVARQRVQVAGPAVWSECPPPRLRATRGPDRASHVVRAPLAEGSDDLSRGGVGRIEPVAQRAVVPAATDEVVEGPVVPLQPGLGERGALGCGAVLERLEDLGDLAHR